MSFWERIARCNFLIRLRSWEYWPFGIIQFPAMMYWLLLSLRARSLVFFSASNPGIPMGGMFGESKYDVLRKIPCRWIPRTLLVPFPASLVDVQTALAEAGMPLPLIFKPDIGERGYLVQRIDNERDIISYLLRIKGAFMAQELVELPLEFGVFYMRMPEESRGSVTSVVAKEMLSVTGDGIATLQELIWRKDRAKLQWQKLKVVFHDRLLQVLPRGEKLDLVTIGNHAMGTMFINANQLINDRLSRTFDHISSQIGGFYFGRFDLRCASVEDLYDGKVKIMELNGCGAEPGHIYDPGFSLWQAIKVQVGHWHSIFRVSRANKNLGFRYISYREALDHYRKFKAVVK